MVPNDVRFSHKSTPIFLNIICFGKVVCLLFLNDRLSQTEIASIMARLCFIGSSGSKLFPFFLSFLLILLQCNAISHEGKILLQIKEKDWIDKHKLLSNWNSSHEYPCDWNGVFCNIAFNVIKVNLSNTFIAGVLTSTICGLQNLTDLILQSNDFQGPFPDGLLACKHL